MMKMIEDLETRVLALLSQITDLKNENVRLREENETRLRALTEENVRLKNSLDEEAAARQDVLGRIDTLIRTMEEQDATLNGSDYTPPPSHDYQGAGHDILGDDFDQAKE